MENLENVLIGAAMAVAQLVHEDEEEEGEVLTRAVIASMEGNSRQAPPRIKNYLNVVAAYDLGTFQSHFRLTRESYEALLVTMSPLLNQDYHRAVDANKQLLAVIWLLATPDSFRSVADRFDLSKGGLHDCFVRVVRALNSIASRVIKWPTEEQRVQISHQFARFAGLQGVVGAVDGTYINVTAPLEEPQRYINRKGNHAITLQAIAEPSLKFTDCFAGFPGSVSDHRIFINSDIYKNISENPEAYLSPGQYLIGDKAYPQRLNWCKTPFIDRGRLRADQVQYNTNHSSTRQVIERAFALLFGRFRRLKFLDMKRSDLIPSVILACCVLHNLCLDNEDNLLEAYIVEGRQGREDVEE